MGMVGAEATFLGAAGTAGASALLILIAESSLAGSLALYLFTLFSAM